MQEQNAGVPRILVVQIPAVLGCPPGLEFLTVMQKIVVKEIDNTCAGNVQIMLIILIFLKTLLTYYSLQTKVANNFKTLSQTVVCFLNLPVTSSDS